MVPNSWFIHVTLILPAYVLFTDRYTALRIGSASTRTRTRCGWSCCAATARA